MPISIVASPILVFRFGVLVFGVWPAPIHSTRIPILGICRLCLLVPSCQVLGTPFPPWQRARLLVS